MSYSGIQVSAWVKIEEGCPINYLVCGGEAEFSIGGRQNDLQLIATERGLMALITSANDALATIRERAIGE